MQGRVAFWVTFFFLLIAVGHMNAYGQYYLFRSDDPAKADVSFVKHAVEAKANSSVFNVVKIVNPTNSSQTYRLTLTVPEGWSVLGEPIQELTLASHDSVLVPVRVAVASTARGEIGYSLIASITDVRGNLIKNEYSFVKIPSERNLRVRLLNRIVYFDKKTTSATFRIKAENRGNRNELIYFNFLGDRNIIIGESDLDVYNTDISLPPYTDSIISLSVKLKDGFQTSGKDMYALNMHASTLDTSFNGTVWFRYLENKYEGQIPESQKALVVELIGQGLFNAIYTPNYIATLYGTILLNNGADLYYYYRNKGSQTDADLYRYNRMFVGFRNEYLNLKLGDITTTLEANMYGRGAEAKVTVGNNTIHAIGTSDMRQPKRNVGAEVVHTINKFGAVRVGGAFNLDDTQHETGNLGFVGATINSLKYQSLNFMVGASQNKFRLDSSFTKLGLGYELNYMLSKGRVYLNFRNKYGSREYTGVYRGRFDLIGMGIVKLSEKAALDFNLFDLRYDPAVYVNGVLQADKFSNIQQLQAYYRYNFTPRFILYGGPGLDNAWSNNFASLSGDDYFAGRVYKFQGGLRMRSEGNNVTLNPSITLGLVDIYHFSKVLYGITHSDITSKKPFPYQSFSLNLRARMWGFTAMYNNGPRALYEQYNYFYGSKQSKALRFMPYFDGFIYKKELQLSIRASYTNDLVTNNRYTTLTSQVYYYFPRDWRAYFLNVYSMQTKVSSGGSTDATNAGATSKYSTMYFEIGIRKEFAIPQPRLKFYDIKLVFFKDLNGNGVKDDNEPGIPNVLAGIERQEDSKSVYASQVFTSQELLSDQTGSVYYNNIPQGVYAFNYNTVGAESGNFTKAAENLTYVVDKNNTFYLPYVEKNKVFGKIILNRSRISALGRVDLANIRVTATDSQGRIYSTLTDGDGKFTIYAPVTDKYNVSVSNVLYENFDLRQNNFLVQFNGYKQFEVNFVFDEKIRTINFSKSGGGVDLAGVMEVRRTNLRGMIKDATTLRPVLAKINIINKKNNQIIASITSNQNTGEYNVSFAAGDNYVIEVVADGYWYYSENLDLEQITTFQDVNKDVALTSITVGASLELKNLLFDSKKADLSPEALADLTRLVGILKDNPNIKIQIQGHCDDLEALDMPNIGDERAKSVARFLVENGYSKFETRNMGNTMPVAPNDSEANRRLNRRVDIVVLSK